MQTPTTQPASVAAHTPGPWAWHDGHTLRAKTPNPGASSVHTILSSDGGECGYLESDFRQTMAEQNIANANPKKLGCASQRFCVFPSVGAEPRPRRHRQSHKRRRMNAPTYSWEKLHIPGLPMFLGLWLIVTRFNFSYFAVQDDFGNLVCVHDLFGNLMCVPE